MVLLTLSLVEREFFSDTYRENLLELLEVNFTNLFINFYNWVPPSSELFILSSQQFPNFSSGFPKGDTRVDHS